MSTTEATVSPFWIFEFEDGAIFKTAPLLPRHIDSHSHLNDHQRWSLHMQQPDMVHILVRHAATVAACAVVTLILLPQSVATVAVESGTSLSWEGGGRPPHAVSHHSPVGPARTACIQASLTQCSFNGRVLLPGSALFNAAVRIDNARVEVAPAVIAVPNNVTDVQCALQAARSCVSPFSVLSGGHSAAGYGLSAGGLVLSLRAPHVPPAPPLQGGLAGVGSVDTTSGVLRVGAGARYGEVYTAVNGTEWVPIGGGCPQVGVGGYILGGGWSFLSRSYGLAIDKLAAVELVLANGTFVRIEASAVASAPPHSPLYELWFALRGGGGGNFGVATAFELQLVRPAPVMLVGELCWEPFSVAVESIWAVWLKQWQTMPNWLNIDPVWLPIGQNSSRLFCLTVACNNPDQAACTTALAPYRAVTGTTIDSLKFQPFLNWQMANVNATDAQSGELYLKSGVILPGALTLNMIAMLQAAIKASPSDRNLVLFHVGGGAITDVASNATAFPHRNAQVIIQVKAIWTDKSPAAQKANFDWVDNLFASIAPSLSGAYINYIDADLKEWQTAYYGKNYPRLQQVKADVDPSNFFSFRQSIELPSFLERGR